MIVFCDIDNISHNIIRDGEIDAEVTEVTGVHKHIPETIFIEMECCEKRDDDIITNDITSNTDDNDITNNIDDIIIKTDDIITNDITNNTEYIHNDNTAHIMSMYVCVCVCVYVCIYCMYACSAQCTPCRLTFISYGDISKNTATSWSSGSHSTHTHCTASDSFTPSTRALLDIRTQTLL